MSPPTVIIIGAGWAGLAAARTYLAINPSALLTILDDDTSVGGVWSKARLYPGLIADSPNGLYEFSDLSMVQDEKERYTLISGAQVHTYLEAYARKWDLLRRIRFGIKVVSVRRRGEGREGGEGWVLVTEEGERFECDKLVVASGLYSKPYVPALPGVEDFAGPMLHSKALGQESARLTAESVEEVVVVGGCKSAIEAATICLNAGKKVHWVVRSTEQGVPIILSDPDMRPSLVAANNARLLSIWNPSIFATDGFWYNFLHSGRWWLGNFLYDSFWNLMSGAVLSAAGYEKSENGRKIKPRNKNLFRTILSASLLHKGNTFLEELHKGENIFIHSGSPAKMVKEGMVIDNGETVKADAAVFATGWESSTDFFTDEDALELGLPIPPEKQDAQTKKHWDALQDEADAVVISILPSLAKWSRPPPDLRTTQFRMYHQILSPKLLARGDRSITFAGFVSNTQTAFCSEVIALWAVAWMEGIYPKSSLPTEAHMEKEVAKVNAWMARRHGRKGLQGPEIALEIQTYFDALMKDMGLEINRKRRGFFGILKEWLLPYQASDYSGIIEEYLASVQKRK